MLALLLQLFQGLIFHFLEYMFLVLRYPLQLTPLLFFLPSSLSKHFHAYQGQSHHQSNPTYSHASSQTSITPLHRPSSSLHLRQERPASLTSSSPCPDAPVRARAASACSRLPSLFSCHPGCAQANPCSGRDTRPYLNYTLMAK